MVEIDPEHHPKVRRSKMARLNPPSFAAMIKVMQERDCSIPELEKITGLHEWTIRHYCKALVLAQAAHIAGWDKDQMGRDTTARYRLGYGVNVPRAHKTGAQRQKDRRERLRKQAKAVNESLYCK